MTLEELLSNLAIRYDPKEPYLNFQLQIEHNENEIPFINKTNVTKATNAEVNWNEKTITLKYKYKG